MFDLMVCKVKLFGGLEILLLDMVGFIIDLLMELIVVFCVIFEEVKEVDLIIYVIDVVDLDMQGCVVDVNLVFDQIEVGKVYDQFEIEVWNKIDMLDVELFEDFELDCLLVNCKVECIVKLVVFVYIGECIDVLLDVIEIILVECGEVMELVLLLVEGWVLVWLMVNVDVISQDIDMEIGMVYG